MACNEYICGVLFMVRENREVKDSVFTDLFYTDRDAKQNLLSLYNALYGTNYQDTGVIDMVRLDDVLFQNFRNDIAFSVEGHRIILGEHQSTINKNMPLRNLLYIAREYEKIVPIKDRYRRSQVKIPTPSFVTFYNGVENYPKEVILKLSDAFMEKDDSVELELMTRVININTNKSHEVLEKCPILQEYSGFVEKTRGKKGDKVSLEEAVKECIRKGILKEYLERKGSEVVNMLMAEYDYATDIEVQRDEAKEEGREEERNVLVRIMHGNGMAPEEIARMTNLDLEIVMSILRDAKE